MTLKYESEILFDLMKRDGDDTPSDVLPYESELKEKYLQQIEGAYPKLMDYRPEWLNYNLVAHLPADFPVETLSDVTEATVNHVVPYAYGRASLKGQTLVNLLDRNRMTADGLAYTFDNGNYTINSSKTWAKMIFTPNLVQNKKYLVMLSTSIPDVIIYYRNSSNEATRICDGTQCPFVFTNRVDNLATVSIEFPTMVTNGTVSQPMFIEYQDGMENWDISYFEGMKSVQMPVLTTTGKNLYDFKLERGNHAGGTNNIRCKTFEVEELTTYTISNNMGYTINVYFNNENNTEIGMVSGETNQKTLTFTTPQGTKRMWFRTWSNMNDINVKFQIEKGTQATAYEPFKSNILTVNEEVELREIGDVKDELNLLTGELTQRIGEAVLNGSERWYGKTGDYRVEIPNVKGYKDLKWGQKSALSNLYPPYEGTETDSYILNDWDGNQIRVHDINITLEELKAKLAKNPLHVIFILNEESVKKVDLTATDQDGNSESTIRPLEGTMHLMTEGESIKPLFSGEIPVEATTQNLNSFINMKEEE